MTIRECTRTHYADDERGFYYTFEPIEDTITVEERSNGGFIARYLTRDEDYETPDAWGDDDGNDDIFLVHYHRQFFVKNDIMTEQDLHNYVNDDFDDDDGKAGFDREFHIFEVSALIHSGVWLNVGRVGFPSDPGGWDTSHCGAVLVKKVKENGWEDKEKAFKAAESLVREWNQALSGDVYCCVHETYDADKDREDYDICGGYYGLEHAKEMLEEDIFEK